MFSLFYLLAQAQQAPRLPWGYLVLFGLLAVAAVGLLIYFLTRVRKSEKDAEEDWGFSSRAILLRPDAGAGSELGKGQQISAKTLPKQEEPESAVVAASEPSEARLAAEGPEPALPQLSPETVSSPIAHADAIEPAEVTPPQTQRPLVEQESLSQAEQVEHADQGSLSRVEEQVKHADQGSLSQVEEQMEHADQGSPFDEEVWSQLEHPGSFVAPGPTEFAGSTAGPGAPREPYEPPRIVPIVPRTETEQPAPETGRPLSRQAPAPEIGRPFSLSQKPAKQARLEVQPRPSQSTKAATAAAGSILGLPAEVSAGPFIIDRSRGRQDAAEVGTLANYDRAPDDAAGHSGTIALLIAIVLVCGSLAAYFALPSVHVKVDEWVAHVRGIKEPPKPVAQVFPSTLDETKDPAIAKGALQNISDQPLTGLAVIVSLEPRGGGAAVTQDVPVTPDEIAPGQQGTYEFQIETKKYQRYKVAGLKSKDGVTLTYVKPNQQQQ